MLKHIIREDVQLNEEFFAVLSKHLVTPTPGPEAWAPLLEQSFNFASRCINGSMRDSPTPANHQNNSVVNLSVLGINSALRKMSLNSSPAPASLANLMHSPQLMQKAQLRQREREIKRLELGLKNEQYMRCDLELDLKEKCSTLEQKELKIRELKESIKEQRKLRDAVDELDDHVQKLNEKLNQFLQSSKAKMTEFQEMKQQKEYFEKQYEETLSQYNQMEEAMCSLISFKEKYHEYRSKCHTQEEEMLALQSRLQHRAEEIEALKGELSSMNEARQCVLQQFNDMKREKGELEDMFAANNMGGCVGESMGVVTDIRIRDLEAELTHLKSAWIDPITHDQVKKELLRMTKAMEACQTKFSEVHTPQAKKPREEQDALTSLRSSEEGLSSQGQEMEETVTRLKKELSHSQAEYSLLRQEFDREKQIYENRRRTMTASYDTVLSERTALEQTLSKEKASLMNQIEDLQSQQEESAQKELAQKDQNIEELKQQFQSIRPESEMEVDKQTEEINNLVHEVDQLKSENERLKTNCVNEVLRLHQQLQHREAELLVAREEVKSKQDLLKEKNSKKNTAKKKIIEFKQADNKQLKHLQANSLTNKVLSGMFHCEDEPEEFEWNRLTELQRRNTLCLPHLKTSYPVETQQVKLKKINHDALRQSIMPSGSGKKRKLLQLSDNDDQKASMNPRSRQQMNRLTTPVIKLSSVDILEHQF